MHVWRCFRVPPRTEEREREQGLLNVQYAQQSDYHVRSIYLNKIPNIMNQACSLQGNA
jgi:hypothetical protein